jgi:hypothetical protein
MLVQALSFGTNWWARFGHDPLDPHRFTRRAAYYNSTGVRCGSKVRRYWSVPGLVRFNGVGGFNPDLPQSAVGRTFSCSELEFAFGGNRLVFVARAGRSAVPDCYLVVINSADHGSFNLSSFACKSPSTAVIAASRLRDTEETMLLMYPGDWVETRRGLWQLQPCDSAGKSARLELVSCAPPIEVG